VFRLLQGVGGGMLTPVGGTMVFRAFPVAERSKASGMIAIPTTVAPAAGPVLGGFLVEYVSWEWIFLANVPVGVIGLIVCARWLKEQKEGDPGTFDVSGFMLASSGMGALLYALARAGSHNLDDSRVILFGTLGVLLLVVFAVVELRTKEPMIDVRLLANRLFAASNAVQFVGMTGFAAVLFVLPLFLQAERGLNAFESGLATFPTALGVMAAAAPSTRLYPKVGPRRLLLFGVALTGAMGVAFAWVDLDTDIWIVRLLMFLRGIGFGFFFIPLQAATFATISHEMTGRASSVFSSGRMVSQSLGVAIVATALTAFLSNHDAIQGTATPAAIEAYQEAFIVAGAMTLLAVPVAFLVRDRDAAASMAPVVEGAEQAEGAPATAS